MRVLLTLALTATLHASGVARRDVRGEDAGLVEAYADIRKEFAFDELRVRGGFFFLPTSKDSRSRTARYELFATEEKDDTPLGEDNDESGKSWTLTWMVDITSAIRGAAELTQISGNREAAQQYGFDPSTTGRSFTLEARYRFQRRYPPRRLRRTRRVRRVSR